jgi:hypothetical protein
VGAIGPNDFPRQANGYGQASLFCKPICKPDAARQLETGETESTVRDGSVLFAESPRPRETARDGRDARRMAHNPEGEGSNRSPTTKARGPFSNRERAFCMWSANGFANEAWPHAVSPR